MLGYQYVHMRLLVTGGVGFTRLPAPKRSDGGQVGSNIL